MSECKHHFITSYDALKCALCGKRISEIEFNAIIRANDEFVQTIADLRQRQAWIDQVARPEHPDDERPWAAAYLDARAIVERIQAQAVAYRAEYEAYVKKNCKLIRHAVVDGLGYPDDVEGKCGGYAQNIDEPHETCQECIAAYDPEAEFNTNLSSDAGAGKPITCPKCGSTNVWVQERGGVPVLDGRRECRDCPAVWGGKWG